MIFSYLFVSSVIPRQCDHATVADPDFELRRGAVLFYLLSRLFFLQSFLLGGGRPPGLLPQIHYYARIARTWRFRYVQAWRICPLQIHNNFRIAWLFQTNMTKHRIFSLGSKEAFCSNSINISHCRCKRKFSKCQAHADFIVCTSSVISSSCKRT